MNWPDRCQLDLNANIVIERKSRNVKWMNVWGMIPLRAIMNPVINSGVQPPMAKTVRPITDSGMLNVWPRNCVIYNETIDHAICHLSLTYHNQHEEDQVSNDTNPYDAQQECQHVKFALSFRIWHGAREHHTNRPSVIPENCPGQ